MARESSNDNGFVLGPGRNVVVGSLCLLLSSLATSLGCYGLLALCEKFDFWYSFDVVVFTIMMPFTVVIGIATLLNRSLIERSIFAVLATVTVGFGFFVCEFMFPEWGQINPTAPMKQWQQQLMFVLTFSIPCATARVFLNAKIEFGRPRGQSSAVVDPALLETLMFFVPKAFVLGVAFVCCILWLLDDESIGRGLSVCILVALLSCFLFGNVNLLFPGYLADYIEEIGIWNVVQGRIIAVATCLILSAFSALILRLLGFRVERGFKQSSKDELDLAGTNIATKLERVSRTS